MADKVYSSMPSIGIPTDRLSIPLPLKGTFNFGLLIPLDALPILPGDHVRTDVYGIIRMSTPIAPFMDDIEANLYSMFVPYRLVFSKFEEWFTSGNENNAKGGPIQLGNFSELPCYSVFEGVAVHSAADYLGKPITNYDGSKAGPTGYGIVNSLKERAYFKAWADWFIPEQVVTAQVRDSSGYGVYIGTTVIGGVTKTYSPGVAGDLLPVCKGYDYFTSATLSPQYANAAVTIPLGTSAPVTASITPLPVVSSLPGNDKLQTINGSNQVQLSANQGYGGQDIVVNLPQLTADLSAATAATINTLRQAFAIQRYCEAANYGNRFFEVLQAHYAVTSPDARLQRTEYIGHQSFLINVDEVVSTAGYQAGTSTEVGQPGSISRTGFNYYLGHKSFVEPGVLLTMLSTRQKTHTYKQGLMREDCLLTKFQMFSPEFQNLGDQSVLNKEIYLQGNAADEQVFGYQQHWQEYRNRPPRTSGLLNVAASNSLNFWTLADNFASLPQLSAAFLFENRQNIQRVLTTGSTGPDFLFDLVIKYTADREVRTHSIPGLIDHFGTH